MWNRAHVGDGKMKRPTQQISKLKVNAHLEVLETAKLHQYIAELEKAVKNKPVKRGKWLNNRGIAAKIEYDADGNMLPVEARCSKCGTWLVASDSDPVKGNFCPVCGCDMREVEK